MPTYVTSTDWSGISSGQLHIKVHSALIVLLFSIYVVLRFYKFVTVSNLSGPIASSSVLLYGNTVGFKFTVLL